MEVFGPNDLREMEDEDVLGFMDRNGIGFAMLHVDTQYLFDLAGEMVEAGKGVVVLMRTFGVSEVAGQKPFDYGILQEKGAFLAWRYDGVSEVNWGLARFSEFLAEKE